MNLDPITPYQIIDKLRKENEALKIENERLKAQVAEDDTVERTDN